MSGHRVHSFSFGITSAEAAWRDAQRYGAGALRLQFADTLCEDEDTYRFGVEAAGHVLGADARAVSSLAARARVLTPLEVDDLPRRKAELAALARDAMQAMPGLTWLQDGRTVWEVFRQERYIGNSRVCPATEALKTRHLDANRLPGATVVVGLDWTEEHRLVRVRRRVAPAPVDAPMCDEPALWKHQLFDRWRARGIEPPRMYEALPGVGFPHGNCGGACARGGKSAWRLLLRWNRPRYVWHEREELATQAVIGKPYTILSETRRGVEYSLSLRAYRERLEEGELFPSDDWGACGCGVGDEGAAA